MTSTLPATPDQASVAVGEFVVALRHEWRYPVQWAPGLIATYGTILRTHLGRRAVVVLTDETVHELYARELARSFAEADLPAKWIVIPPDEDSKSLPMFAMLVDRLAELGLDRRGVLVNFGGGVICDLGGFVAASYMRGVDYANFGTTLIAQLDASLGGKVAVNSSRAKNMIGAFHHPRHVAADPMLLRSLTQRDLKSGIAEAIKVAIIGSPTLFELLRTRRDAIVARCPETLSAIVGLSAKLKMDLVLQDPYEQDLRRPLNLGHTLGHAIESAFGYQVIKHGEAVALGMRIATTISLCRGAISDWDAQRIFDLLDAYDLLRFSEPLPIQQVLEKLCYIRLIRGNHLHFVLPRRIGLVDIVDTVTEAEIEAAFRAHADLTARSSG